MDEASGPAQYGSKDGFMPKCGIVLFLIGLAACSPGGQKNSQAPAGKQSAGRVADTGHTPRPVRHVAGEGLFHGYACEWDCSTHLQGYAWASEHRIENPKDCRGPSQSFVEGCLAFTGQDGPLGQREIFQDED